MRNTRLAAGGYLVAVGVFAAIAGYYGVLKPLGPLAVPAFVTLALLFAPYWFFGFGAAEGLSGLLDRGWKRALGSGALLVPWVLFGAAAGTLSVRMFGALLLTAVLLHAPLEVARRRRSPCWEQFAAMGVLAVAVEAPYLRNVFVGPGLSNLSKLLFIDAGLYGFLVVNRLDGVGFDLRLRVRDFAIGLREFAYFLPIALAIGFGLSFLRWRPGLLLAGLPLAQFAAAWFFTFFFVALPEEIFFRGFLLNLLERRLGRTRALLLSALIFGLAHFPKGATFNWRYVTLAAIAGIFYGRAWLDRRRVAASAITHSTVDAIWSVWLR